MRRVKKHLNAIAADDALLIRENWGSSLKAWEVQDALEERGMCVLSFFYTNPWCLQEASCSVTEGLAIEGMRARLRWWLDGVSEQDSDPVRRRVQLIAANVIGRHA